MRQIKLTSKRDLIILFKSFGPLWMYVVLFTLMLPMMLFSGGYFLSALAQVIKALHS